MLMKKGSLDFAASSKKAIPDCSTYLSINGIPTTPSLPIIVGVSTYCPFTLKSSRGFSPALPESEPLVIFQNMPDLLL